MKNMLRVFLIAVIAVLTCGFIVETDEQRKKNERMAREWAKTIQTRYDLAALNSFLKKTVAEKKRWEDIDLTKPKIGDKWTVRVMAMNSGNWNFTTPDPKKDKFSLSFTHRSEGDSRWDITLHCIRKSKDVFELVEITNDEWIILHP